MGYQELFQRLVPIELRPALGEALSADEVGAGDSSSTSGVLLEVAAVRTLVAGCEW
jgi:hypothetical protein